LCEALRNSGLGGNPDEYFGPMHVARWNEKWKTRTDDEYLQRVWKQGSGLNGVWGAKVMRLYWQDFLDLLRNIDGSSGLSDAELLDAHFPNLKYVFITRRNKVRQAVSWLKFIQGAAWFWEKDEPEQLAHAKFNPQVIDDFLRQTAVHESAWIEFFAQVQAQPHIVVYEDLVSAYEETAVGVLDYLGIDRPTSLVFGERKLKKQADTISDEWVQRYFELNRHMERLG
jgi:LPS sulfotransferase NodH